MGQGEESCYLLPEALSPNPPLLLDCLLTPLIPKNISVVFVEVRKKWPQRCKFSHNL